jgi:L-histidine Nalpha-methyltransferase
MSDLTACVCAGQDDDEREIFRRDVIEGLSGDRKRLPAKYFYDARGSQLFDQICELDEYYPTRTETGILRDIAHEVSQLSGPAPAIVEFGSGSSTKIRILLDELRPAAYVPIDISHEHLMLAADGIARDYPGLRVVPVTGDFTRALALPDLGDAARVGFFPGSTIGNFTPQGAEDFMREARMTLGAGAGFLVGVDLVKNRARLEAAYNDQRGVTAAFNLNLLRRINRELDGRFDLAGFRHFARFNEAQSRIEMHLESLREQSVQAAGHEFRFAAGETIHTENSYKYSMTGFADLCRRAGWQVRKSWTDTAELFSVHYLSAE